LVGKTRFGKRNSVSVAFAVAIAAAAIVVAIGSAYVVTTLPGSIGTTTSSPITPTSFSITPRPNPPTTLSYAIVYIPAGAAIESSVANFNPNSVTVSISGHNNTVVWKNLDSNVQEVMGANGMFSSGNLTQGDSWNYTFTSAGQYQYQDPYYPWLNGTVTVVS
jgi:plastocyanin